jgi:hypothetical protein
MVGKSAAAAKGRAKLEAFKAARAKKGNAETVPIPEPEATQSVAPAEAPVVVPAPTKPVPVSDDRRFRGGQPALTVPESPPRAPADLESSVPVPIPGDVPGTTAGSLSSAYTAIADEYLPATRSVPPATQPTAPGRIAGDEGTQGAGTASVDSVDVRVRVAKDELVKQNNHGVATPTDDSEPPPFVSPFKKPGQNSGQHGFEERVVSIDRTPFAPKLTSTPLLRFAAAAATTGRGENENSVSSLDDYFAKPSATKKPSVPSFLSSSAAAERSEVQALHKLFDDMTHERMQFQRGLDKQQVLMQTLATENEEMTVKLNEQAAEVVALREFSKRAQVSIRARDDALTLCVDERDVAKLTAIESHERASRSAVECVELEEKLRAARNETLRLRHVMETEHGDLERRDRAARAAATDRDEMASVIEGFRREREFLRNKLRDAAQREERDMERDFSGYGERDGDDDEDGDEETKNTGRDPGRARTQQTSSSRPVDASGTDESHGNTTSREDPGRPSGFFHFVSRANTGDGAGSFSNDVGEDQLRLVDSIHTLLSEVELERARGKKVLEETKAKLQELENTNQALQRRLAGKREMAMAGYSNAMEGPAFSMEGTANAMQGTSETKDGEYSDYYLDVSRQSEIDEDDDEDKWSDDDVSAPGRKRGFLSSLNPFGRRT